MNEEVNKRDLEKAALRGEPSYVWRDGQQRRLNMILAAVGERVNGAVFENGCGVGMYMEHLKPYGGKVFGLEYDFPRAVQAHVNNDLIICGAGEALPLPGNSFDVILSHEVIEHVINDREAMHEMVRTLKPNGRAVIFCPNRWYPFETHGIFWRGNYKFGNIPLVNYLPRLLRDKLAPHVEVYTRRDIRQLFMGLQIKLIQHKVIFGAYDNIIARWPRVGKLLRSILQFLERTPLSVFGLSHFVVVEKIS
ncbi:MAG: class I SAM-dependent methyltransferase [Chloroflexota bacterium]